MNGRFPTLVWRSLSPVRAYKMQLIAFLTLFQEMVRKKIVQVGLLMRR